MHSVILNMLYLTLLMNSSENSTSGSQTQFYRTNSSEDCSDCSWKVNASTNGIQVSRKTLPISEAPLKVEEEPGQVCYFLFGEEVCFEVGGPWSKNKSRPVVKVPNAPFDIGTTFYLHSRAQQHSRLLVLDPDDREIFKNLSLVSGHVQNFKILAHGYMSSSQARWIKAAVAELLRAEDDVIIVTDWKKGATSPYVQAAANIRVVGVQVARLIIYLVNHAKIPLTSIHLIGHSLGAHLLAHCGQFINETYGLVLPRITALDPAGPYFADMPPIARLDPTDAEFIDVIHTDNSPFLGFPFSVGLANPVGHIDFYPNGGSEQPHCSYGNFHYCQHMRAAQLFIESVRQSCVFMGVVCESYDHFLKGYCWGCQDGNSCSPMGMKAISLPSRPVMTKLFLMTYGNSPFCGAQYRITIKSCNDSQSWFYGGEFALIGIELIGARDTTGEVLLSEKSMFYNAGSIHRKVILAINVGDVKSVAVSFHYPGSLFNPMSWRISGPLLYLESVTVELLQPAQRWRFCFANKILTSDIKYTLESENLC